MATSRPNRFPETSFVVSICVQPHDLLFPEVKLPGVTFELFPQSQRHSHLRRANPGTNRIAVSIPKRRPERSLAVDFPLDSIPMQPQDFVFPLLRSDPLTSDDFPQSHKQFQKTNGVSHVDREITESLPKRLPSKFMSAGIYSLI